MKIAFCSSEVFPFAKTGGLGDVCGSLPIELQKEGNDVSIFMPGYRSVAQRGHAIEQLNESVSRTTIEPNINVYFIGHKQYYDRAGLYGDNSGDYPDNVERYSHYCQCVLSLLKQLDIRPDIIHCHDWHAALIPVYMKERYGNDAFFAKTKCVLTIHNLAFQGVFPKDQFAKLGLRNELFAPDGFEFYGQVNFLKAGILFSDSVTTVSPQYAHEIQTKEFGCGLDDVIRRRAGHIVGILNGLDQNIWNPLTDRHITQTYSVEQYTEAKLVNKTQLQRELGLKVTDEVPLFSFIGRLSHQKGIDLIIDNIEPYIQQGIQMVFLGLGDNGYKVQLRQLASRYPANVAFDTDFNEPLGHRIYAGSDFFLMPSRFEPCGLGQMIGLSYGSIPVVFKTGGLADTVKMYSATNRSGNGIVFTKYTKNAFSRAIVRAVTIFRQKTKFGQMRDNAFRSQFTWKDSVQKYLEAYQCA